MVGQKRCQRAGLSALTLVLFTSGCGSSSVAPSPTVPAALIYTGVWLVTYFGENHFLCSTGAGTQTLTTTFRLAQHGNAVSGTIFSVDVSGVVGTDGSVSLDGNTTNQFPTGGQVHASLRPFGDQSGFSGMLNATLRSTSCSTVVSGQIVNSQRQIIDASTGAFAGTWEGLYGVQDCSRADQPLPNSGCIPFPIKAQLVGFNLSLTQAGSSVSGVLNVINNASEGNIPVSGTVTGNQLVLQGSVQRVLGGGTPIQIQLTSWSTARDEVGRMTGTFSFIYAFTSSGVVISTTYQNVLVDVTLDVTK